MSQENETTVVEFGYNYTNHLGEKRFMRNVFVKEEELEHKIMERNNVGVFRSAYSYDQVTNFSSSLLYGDLYFDLDSEHSFEEVRQDFNVLFWFLNIVFQLKEQDIKVYYSGNKGLHVIVPATCFHLTPTPRLNEVYKMIAVDARKQSKFNTIDLKVYDNRRLFRIAGSVHDKSGLYKIPLTLTELRECSVEEIKAMAKTKREEVCVTPTMNHFATKQLDYYVSQLERVDKEFKRQMKRKRKQHFNYVPPCIKWLVDNGATSGGRNHSVACLASFCYNYGKQLDETIAFIDNWNLAKNAPPLPTYEVKRTVKSIFDSIERSGGDGYGCSKLKETLECDEANCKLKREKRI